MSDHLDTDMPLSDKEKEEFTRYANMILAATLSERTVAYKGLLDGKEVIIFGAAFPQEDGRINAKPLALIYNDTINDLVRVPHSSTPDGKPKESDGTG